MPGGSTHAAAVPVNWLHQHAASHQASSVTGSRLPLIDGVALAGRLSRRWRQLAGSLPGAVIEHGGAQYGVRRGQLARAGQPLRASGIVHLVLAFIAFTCIAIGAILISASLVSDPAWRPAGAVLLAISIAGAVAYLLLGTVHKHHHAPGGLYERIFLGLELLWIAVAAIAIVRRTPAPQPE